MQIKSKFLKSKNVTLGPIMDNRKTFYYPWSNLPHTCFVDMFSRHIGFFLEPSLNWRVSLAREPRARAFKVLVSRVSRVLVNVEIFVPQTVASCSCNQAI